MISVCDKGNEVGHRASMKIRGGKFLMLDPKSGAGHQRTISSSNPVFGKLAM